jgi:hypothetical protein
MPWSGGNYTKWNGAGGWTADAAANIGIEAGRHDTQDTDFQNGINNCLAKDGTNAATGNLNIGGNKITNLGEAIANGQAISYDQLTDGSPLGVNFSTNRVGIGTSSPAWIVDVVRNANDSSSLINSANPNAGTSASCGYRFQNDSSNALLRLNSSTNALAGAGGANALVLENNASGPIHFDTGGGIRATIVGSGATTGFFGLNQQAPAVFFDASRSANDTLTRVRVRNANSGSSATAELNIGNNTNDTAAGMQLNSSSNTANAGANGLTIFNGLAANMDFATNGSRRIRISSAGQVNFANGSLTISSTAITSGAGTDFLKYNTSTGLITADSSSQLIKTNVVDCPFGLDAIMSLQPRKYFRVDDQKDEVGFIADEVLEIIPEVVSFCEKSRFTKNPEDTDLVPGSIAYDRLTSVLCKALQELNQKVDLLTARLEELET